MVRDVIDNLLVGRLDVMANTLKISNIDFWNGYHQAREIIDLGSTSAKVRGTVLDENDVPLKQVKFTILKTGTNEGVAEVLTDIKGKFTAKDLPAGNYDFKWVLDGYKTVEEIDVHIAAGKELKRTIVMDAAFVREGNLNAGTMENIEVGSIFGEDDTFTNVILEAPEQPMRYYATSNPSNPPGSVFIAVAAGTTLNKTLIEFAALIGWGDGNGYINVQNTGVGNGSWKITFEK